MNIGELKEKIKDVPDNVEVILQIQDLPKFLEEENIEMYTTLFGYETDVLVKDEDEYEFDPTEGIYIVGKVLDD